MRRPYDPDSRRDEPYWPEAKRLALEDRYHSDFGRQDRFHDFDHRDRGRYQEHCLDRRDCTRGIPDRDGQVCCNKITASVKSQNKLTPKQK
ncbi:scaffold attachment factor B1-like [Pyrgilauda ruficollis]|uniref:scaffold attachment factor B1-like n=1 Tax=Pyrgilauda ruficollis TaxID=221976 RepID=UPI001B87EF3B|nr:scaffold attachment factor B1-like [Pyrgilauda ruficollis]